MMEILSLKEIISGLGISEVFFNLGEKILKLGKFGNYLDNILHARLTRIFNFVIKLNI